MSDWTYSNSTPPPDEVVIKFAVLINGQTQEKSVTLMSTTTSESTAKYETVSWVDQNAGEQEQEVQVSKTDVKTSTIASVNAAYVSWRLANSYSIFDVPSGLPTGNATTRTEETYYYAITSSGPVKTKQVTEAYISEYEFMAGLAMKSKDYALHEPTNDEVLAHRTIVNYETLITEDGREFTRTTTERWICRGKEQHGVTPFAESYSKYAKAGLLSGNNAATIFRGLVNSYKKLIYEGSDVQTSIGKLPIPAKPSRSDTIRSEVANGDQSGYDPKTADSFTKLVPPGADAGVYKQLKEDAAKKREPVPISAFDKVLFGRVYFAGDVLQNPSNPSAINERPYAMAFHEMPFAPDDYFIYQSGNGNITLPNGETITRTLIPGGAMAAARRFGETESAMEIGHAYGVNIVTGFHEMPSLPLSPVYLQEAGLEVAFLTDSLSYAWGPEGMVVSSDLMLLGATGYYGNTPPSSSWVRLPVAPSGLPQVSAV